MSSTLSSITSWNILVGTPLKEAIKNNIKENNLFKIISEYGEEEQIIKNSLLESIRNIGLIIITLGIWFAVQKNRYQSGLLQGDEQGIAKAISALKWGYSGNISKEFYLKISRNSQAINFAVAQTLYNNNNTYRDRLQRGYFQSARVGLEDFSMQCGGAPWELSNALYDNNDLHAMRVNFPILKALLEHSPLADCLLGDPKPYVMDQGLWGGDELPTIKTRLVILLMFANFYKKFDVLNMFFKHGLNPNQCMIDRCFWPLLGTHIRRNTEFYDFEKMSRYHLMLHHHTLTLEHLKFWLAAGLDSNLVVNEGNMSTLLGTIIGFGDIEMLNYLFDQRSDLDFNKLSSNEHPLEIAIKRKHEQIFELLLQQDSVVVPQRVIEMATEIAPTSPQFQILLIKYKASFQC